MEIAFEFRLAQILVSRQSELSEEDDQSTPTDDFVFQDVRREQAQPDPEAARTGDEEPKSLSDFPDSESRRTEAASLPPLSVPTNIDLSGESRDVDWLNYAEYTTIDPFSDVQIARYISPVFLDFNGDGFLDLVTGTAFGNLLIYQGRADGTYAPWEGESPFSQVQVANFSAPAFADLDGDGDLDLAVGAQDGTVTAYRNGGFGWSGAFTPSSSGYPLNGIDAGTGAAPVFVDIDHDGDMDMVVGNGAGPLVTYRNGGDGWAGAFRPWGENDPFAGVPVDEGSTPVFVDLDGDGDLDLVVGTRYGEIISFVNGGNGWRGPLRPLGELDPFKHIDVGDRSAPTFADLDYDGDLDMVTGSAENGLLIYENLSGDAGTFQMAATETLFDPGDGIL